MTNAFVGYIDEAGDQGFKFDKGSTEWFVLSCALVPHEEDLKSMVLLDEVRRIINRKDREPFHFRNLNHEHRLPLVGHIARSYFRFITLIVHKPSITPIFVGRYRFYFEVLNRLLSCIDLFGRAYSATKIQIVLSNLSNLKYEDVEANIEHLKANPSPLFPFSGSLISSQDISIEAPRRLAGLQIADVAASSFLFGLQTRYGYEESRYVRMLQPCVLQTDNCYEGYGIHLWCEDKTALLKANSHLRWLSDVFSL